VLHRKQQHSIETLHFIEIVLHNACIGISQFFRWARKGWDGRKSMQAAAKMQTSLIKSIEKMKLFYSAIKEKYC
jgi:hypothetical protein